MLDTLSTFGNILLMIVGFGFIIAVHELGHFVAARWAGIRVHTFAVGFGSAICSWRKGLGFRWGSSEGEYLRLQGQAGAAQGGDISPTEYRLNWFPFGGYVKMLGQEDANPGATSSEPDSFAAKPVWKRMIVISGGVAMNLVLAAVLFVIAYSVGIREPHAIIGFVEPASPAARAGFEPGDRVLSVDGERIRTFSDIAIATALSAKGQPLAFEIQRLGHDASITIHATPEPGRDGMLQVGVAPAASADIFKTFLSRAERQEFVDALPRLGLSGVRPGMSLVSVNGTSIPNAGTDDALALPLAHAVRDSGGRPIPVVFRGEASSDEVALSVQPRPELQTGFTRVGGATLAFSHLVGLLPVAPILEVQSGGAKAGLQTGDVFVRVGAIEWPSIPDAMAQIRAAKGATINLVVLRGAERIPITAKVNSLGQVGFRFTNPADAPAIIAHAPQFAPPDPAPNATPESAEAADFTEPAAARLSPALLPGSRILSVAGAPVATFGDVREALRRATETAHGAGADARVELALELPIASPDSADAALPTESVTLALSARDVGDLHALEWSADDLLSVFAVAQFTDIARNPVDAIGKGIHKTHGIIVSTYITFLRLFQRSVPADQLRGPVGITHIGSRVASQGFIYLIFFLGLISANLAVINFLPLPIVDGGLMVFLLIEAITKKPVSIAIQNIATIIGLALIGGIFLFVTFHDVMRLVS